METTEIDVLKARAAASQSTATHWRKQCERAEARVRVLEGLLVEAGQRVQAAERARDAALMGQPNKPGNEVAAGWGCR